VLDVGCGGGILAESMARRGADVGIDMGEAPLAVGRLHAQQDNVQNIEYRQIPVEKLAQEQAGQYDVVTCMEMMEHVPDPASLSKPVKLWLNQVVMSSFRPLTVIQNPIYLPLLALNMSYVCCQKVRMIIINLFAHQKWRMIFVTQA
jgi:SAM-dependent methyltransferase